MSARAFVIAYDFPPHGAIGTMRTLRLVRQLHQEGWRVTVLTGSPAAYLPGTPVEPGLESQVPEGVEVVQVRAIRPVATLERLIRRLRSQRPAAPVSGSGPTAPKAARAARAGWRRALSDVVGSVEAALDIPDKESGWIAPAILRGAWQMLRSGRPDVIYSSAPPWSGQVVALWMARLSGRPWVADFRDPWARAPWRDWRRAFRQRAVSRLERRVVARADRVLFVTEANRQEYVDTYGAEAARRFVLVPNGCDPSEFEALAPLPGRDQFVLLHAGTCYGPRSPMPVIEAMARLAARGAIDRARLRLRLVGPINLAVDVPAECRRLGVADMVEFVPRVTREQSLREMKSASALLLIQVGTTVSVPGKAYEYLAAGRPVLALTEEGETAALVRTSGLGVVVRPDEPIERAEEALLEVIAMERRAAAPAHLYDGRIHAATTSALLLTHAGTRDPQLSERTIANVATQEPRQ